MYGLSEDDIDSIKDCLTEYGLEPAEVKPMRLKTPRRDALINYLVYFDPAIGVSLTMLKEVKYVCSTVVSWAHYRQPQTNCVQCRNCFRYNHTAESCHMKPVCMFCAQEHASVDCPLLERKKSTNKDSIPECLLKCCNCKETPHSRQPVLPG